MYSCHGCGGKASDASGTYCFLKCVMFCNELEIVFSEKNQCIDGYVTDLHRRGNI